MTEKQQYVQTTKRIDFTKKKNRAKVHKLLELYGSVDNIPIEFLQSRTLEKYNPDKHDKKNIGGVKNEG